MDKNVIKLGIGTLCILLLFFMYGREETIEWFKLAVLGGLLALFFFSPILDLIFGTFSKEDSLMMLFGIVYLIFYLFVTNSTAEEFTVDFLQSMVVVAVVSFGLDKIERFVTEQVK